MFIAHDRVNLLPAQRNEIRTMTNEKCQMRNGKYPGSAFLTGKSAVLGAVLLKSGKVVVKRSHHRFCNVQSRAHRFSAAPAEPGVGCITGAARFADDFYRPRRFPGK